MFYTEVNEPHTFKEVINSPDDAKWKEAFDDEYNFLIQNQTSCLVDLPSHQSLISCKLILHKKYNANGSILKYKV